LVWPAMNPRGAQLSRRVPARSLDLKRESLRAPQSPAVQATSDCLDTDKAGQRLSSGWVPRSYEEARQSNSHQKWYQLCLDSCCRKASLPCHGRLKANVKSPAARQKPPEVEAQHFGTAFLETSVLVVTRTSLWLQRGCKDPGSGSVPSHPSLCSPFAGVAREVRPVDKARH